MEEFIDQVTDEIQETVDWRSETGNLICDFCSQPNPAWVAICAPYDIDVLGTPHQSEPDMGICDGCKQLIETSNKKGLLDRAVSAQSAHFDIFLRNDVLTRHVMTKFLTDFQNRFWESYMGEIIPQTADTKEQARQRHRMHRG